MDKRVSVVIPAYNAARTVERTVRSVMASTIPLDVWVVDDGSTDETGEVLKKLEGESGRAADGSSLRVLRQPNQGAYMARLNALKRITTPYFGFVDADDIVEPDMFERMIALADRHHLDTVECGYFVERGNREGTKIGCEEGPECLLSRDEVMEKVIGPRYIRGDGSAFVWNKIYRNQYDFETFDPTDRDTTFEDMIFNLQFFTKINSMGFVRIPLYHYVINEGSSVKNFSEKTLHDFGECIRVRKAMLPAYGVDPYSAVNVRWLMLNARNSIITAAVSKRNGISKSAMLIDAILSIPDIRRSPKLNGLVMVAVIVPKTLLILCLRLVARIKGW